MRNESRKDTAAAMGIAFVQLDRPIMKRDSIDGTRPLFKRIWIDTTRCERDCLAKEGYNTWDDDRGGWSAIKHYQFEYDPDREVFSREPFHNWASHPNDALMNLALIDLSTGTKKELRPNAGKRRGTWSGSR
jgi:phage terminase large subunit